MPARVAPTICDGCGGQAEPECRRVCPADIVIVDALTRKAEVVETDTCWDCLACVKACPVEAIAIHGARVILGGGMAGCGAAYEAAWWAQAEGLRVVMVEKGTIERSGAAASGLSAINCFMGTKWGGNQPEDFAHYVCRDLMGLCREDLVYGIARHVDSSVHMFEHWGLPFFKTPDGQFQREGRWQVLILGESYKPIVADAAKEALGPGNVPSGPHWRLGQVRCGNA